MSVDKVIPIVRDVVFLVGGMFVFIREALVDARWAPMLLGMIVAAGPAVVSAYWSTARTPGSEQSGSSPSSSLSSSRSPSSPSPAGEP